MLPFGPLGTVFSPSKRVYRSGIPWMMNLKIRKFPSSFKSVAASLVLLPLIPACAQSAPASAAPAQPAAGDTPAQVADRGQAYYHVAMASIYEDDATSDGQPEFVNRAVE